MKPRTTRKAAATIAALAALGLGLGGCDDLAEVFPTPTEKSGDASALYSGLDMDESQARTALDAFPVSEPRPMKGYNREEKFPHWLSADEWGWSETPDAADCDVRDSALARDGSDVRVNPSTCYPQQGTWTDPYTGETIAEPRDVDIDHVVPLAAAWRAGADEWDEERRTLYANSELGTVATGASSNREKGDKGPEVWKPDNKVAWCPYAIRWIAVKDEYGLHLTSTDERDALAEMLDTCTDEAQAEGDPS